MWKVRVWKDDFTGSWRVQSGSLLLDPDSVAARCPTHAEAMFLAQLLADPHEYIRAAREAAYREGNCVGTKRGFVLAHGIAEDEAPNPYRKEDND